jgi:uncharacterized delta-60 repeat protein
MEVAKSFTIPIADNFVAGTNRQFKIVLSNTPQGVLLGSGPATEAATIHDDERPGSVDFSFAPQLSQVPAYATGVSAFAVQTDGKVLVTGVFNVPDSDTLTSLERLNPDGSPDTSFEIIVSPDEGWGVSASVKSVVPQSDGKILVAGTFNRVNGQSRSGVARLLADGSLDDNFKPLLPIRRAKILALQPDGKVLIAGGFAVSRLNSDGSPDTTFNPSSDDLGEVLAMEVQADGKIILALSKSGTPGRIRRSMQSLYSRTGKFCWRAGLTRLAELRALASLG